MRRGAAAGEGAGGQARAMAPSPRGAHIATLRSAGAPIAAPSLRRRRRRATHPRTQPTPHGAPPRPFQSKRERPRRWPRQRAWTSTGKWTRHWGWRTRRPWTPFGSGHSAGVGGSFSASRAPSPRSRVTSCKGARVRWAIENGVIWMMYTVYVHVLPFRPSLRAPCRFLPVREIPRAALRCAVSILF